MSKGWSVFIDESGRFTPEDPSFVGGILVEGSAGHWASGQLRRQLEAIWAPAPWPPHASDLNRPVARALWALHPDAPRGRFTNDALGRLGDALARSGMRARADAIAGGARPTWEDGQRAEATLGGHGDYPALRAMAEDQERAMGQLVAAVCERSNGTVVAAMADRDPPGPPPAPTRLREDAYVRALAVVFDRLARLGDLPVDVELHVLTRDVEVGGLGNIAMQGHFVKELAQRATAETGSAVRLRPGAVVQRWGRMVHPLLVVADWLTNRLRASAGWSALGYDALERQLGVLVPGHVAFRRAPAHAPHLGALPTLAAAGPPEAFVRSAYAGAPVSPSGSGWAWDQAHAWAAAAGKWR